MLSLSGIGDDVRQRVATIAAAMVDHNGRWAGMPRDQALLRARTVVDVLVSYNEHWLVDGFMSERENDLALIGQVVSTALTAPLALENALKL